MIESYPIKSRQPRFSWIVPQQTYKIHQIYLNELQHIQSLALWIKSNVFNFLLSQVRRAKWILWSIDASWWFQPIWKNGSFPQGIPGWKFQTCVQEVTFRLAFSSLGKQQGQPTTVWCLGHGSIHWVKSFHLRKNSRLLTNVPFKQLGHIIMTWFIG